MAPTATVSAPNEGAKPTAADYFEVNNISPMLESLVAGLAFYRPDDPIAFLQQRLAELKTQQQSTEPVQVIPKELRESAARAKEIATRHVDLNAVPADHSKAATPVNKEKETQLPQASEPAVNVSKSVAADPQPQAAPVEQKQAHKAEPEVPIKPKSATKEERPVSARAATAETKVPAAESLPEPEKVAPVASVEEPKADQTAAADPQPVVASATEAGAEQTPRQLANTVFVLGGPGSGKGTQCARLIAEFGYIHVSVGDLLRAEVAQQTQVGLEMDALMKEGKLVPTATVLGILEARLMEMLATGKGVLIDGYPRELAQAIDFEKKIGLVSKVIYYDCSEEAMKVRLLKRGETSGRSDDNEESIAKRLKTFVEQTVPVAEYFEQRGKLVRIRSDEGTVDDVYAQTRAQFIEKQ